MTDQNEATAWSRTVGAELRRWRERAGFGGSEIARRLSWSPTKVSNMERGKRGVSEADASMYLAVCRAPGVDIEDVRKFFKATEGYWVRSHPEQLSDELRGLIAMETTATAIHSLESLVLPGLLQTEDYIRALITEGGFTRKERIEKLVRARKDRQVLFRRYQPPMLSFFVHERVLFMPVGGATTMNEQLLHLVLTSSQPNVSIRIVPAKVSVMADSAGPFTLQDYSLPRSLVYVESLTASLFIDNKRAVAEHRNALQRLDSVALDRDESRSWLADLANEYDRQREEP
ncbi:putative transcriptional regulator [Herbihabitans rhizosphaerae]|uniref:Putative transcriptional regulator n=1 Tax=Herbihabitans rhizosphaerae TaxID=1872711 RepID=A0A4Q7KCC8_9PSEU|nr:helix-turn-helix transcriptional regulator [Herbihabitans rhizosphaerae]RZS29528.1 putative transcriptional regulator [Herbihabitans rhizosphaerae]